jgi:hypothetical protein
MPYEYDSEDNFNLRRVHERQKKAASLSAASLSVPSSQSDIELDLSELPQDEQERRYYGGKDNKSEATAVSSGEEDEVQEILGSEMRKQKVACGEVFYQYLYPDGGSTRYVGIPPYSGVPGEDDRRTLMRDEDSMVWTTLPPGHCAPRYWDMHPENVNPMVPEDGEDGESRGSSPTASNFSDDRRLKEKKREEKKEDGRYYVSDTEAEDDEDDRDLADSVVPDSDVPKGAQQGRKKYVYYPIPQSRLTIMLPGYPMTDLSLQNLHNCVVLIYHISWRNLGPRKGQLLRITKGMAT